MIGNMSVCKSIIKFMISITSLIIKSAQQFEKIHIFYKILGILQWDGVFFVKGKYLFVVGALGLGLSCLRLGPPWRGVLCYIHVKIIAEIYIYIYIYGINWQVGLNISLSIYIRTIKFEYYVIVNPPKSSSIIKTQRIGNSWGV